MHQYVPVSVSHATSSHNTYECKKALHTVHLCAFFSSRLSPHPLHFKRGGPSELDTIGGLGSGEPREMDDELEELEELLLDDELDVIDETDDETDDELDDELDNELDDELDDELTEELDDELDDSVDLQLEELEEVEELGGAKEVEELEELGGGPGLDETGNSCAIFCIAFSALPFREAIILASSGAGTCMK